MKSPRLRLNVRMMIGLVAVSAVSFWVWRTYLDPVRRWREAVRDTHDRNRRWESVYDAATGQVKGVTPDMVIAEYAGLADDMGQDHQVRMSAVAGLGRLGAQAEGAIPALMAALRDRSPGINSSAMVAIRQILEDNPKDDRIGRKIVDGLFAALKDPDEQVRSLSTNCLVWIGGSKSAIPGVVNALNPTDFDPIERMQVIEALRLSGPRAVAALPVVLEIAEANSIEPGNRGGEAGRRDNAKAQIKAARILRAFGETERAVALLRRLSRDRDPSIGREAAKVLDTIEPAGSEPSP
jgi:HEAT repeat protein